MGDVYHIDVDWRSGARVTYEFPTKAEAIRVAARMAMDQRVVAAACRELVLAQDAEATGSETSRMMNAAIQARKEHGTASSEYAHARKGVEEKIGQKWPIGEDARPTIQDVRAAFQRADSMENGSSEERQAREEAEQMLEEYQGGGAVRGATDDYDNPSSMGFVISAPGAPSTIFKTRQERDAALAQWQKLHPGNSGEMSGHNRAPYIPFYRERISDR